MFAITDSGYRAVSETMALLPGETRVAAIPASLIVKLKADEMKAERANRLRASDWTQMADAPLSVAAKLLWATYRQALRDLPGLSGFPDVPWPTPPSLDGAAGQNGGEPIQL